MRYGKLIFWGLQILEFLILYISVRTVLNSMFFTKLLRNVSSITGLCEIWWFILPPHVVIVRVSLLRFHTTVIALFVSQLRFSHLWNLLKSAYWLYQFRIPTGIFWESHDRWWNGLLIKLWLFAGRGSHYKEVNLVTVKRSTRFLLKCVNYIYISQV